MLIKSPSQHARDEMNSTLSAGGRSLSWSIYSSGLKGFYPCAAPLSSQKQQGSSDSVEPWAQGTQLLVGKLGSDTALADSELCKMKVTVPATPRAFVPARWALLSLFCSPYSAIRLWCQLHHTDQEMGSQESQSHPAGRWQRPALEAGWGSRTAAVPTWRVLAHDLGPSEPEWGLATRPHDGGGLLANPTLWPRRGFWGDSCWPYCLLTVGWHDISGLWNPTDLGSASNQLWGGPWTHCFGSQGAASWTWGWWVRTGCCEGQESTGTAPDQLPDGGCRLVTKSLPPLRAGIWLFPVLGWTVFPKDAPIPPESTNMLFYTTKGTLQTW